MDDVIEALNRIAENLRTGVPAWVTIIGAIAPIILTIITIVLSVQIHRQNKNLQKMIHNRDVINQSRKEILSVYNAFSTSLLTLQKCGPVEGVFSSEYGTYQWNQEIMDSRIEVINACNTANLLLDDKALTDYLAKLRDLFSEISNDVSRYIYSGLHNNTRAEAISRVAKQYGVSESYVLSPYASPSVKDQLINGCKNSFTKEITEKIENYSKLIEDKAFSSLFEKYIRIKQL